MLLSDYRNRLDDYLDEYRATCKQLETNVNECNALSTSLEAAEEARDIAQGIAETIQQEAHAKISSVVSTCLSTVFPDDPYTFKVIFESKRHKTQAKLVFERNGIEVDPLSASGGGVVDVASFALRLACLLLNKPALQRVLVLDEPFKFVSEGYQPLVRQMLEDLESKLNIQIIMVTHIPALITGKRIEL